ncbi:4-hydroxybenzoate octaprenyltransferase [Deinococcus aetherius]|uniref:4-hydroxybenzoate octaprenyltransferase n=1 Tax=Deinococcus aetherius TaxID=200252 RepID=A0ABN6RC93_9DEIO|nr:4-hydroxybenzoate octaprenyltransferase [Deinococcus aetherius]
MCALSPGSRCGGGVSCGIVSAAARVKTYLDLVKFEHTVFALPFAYAGMLLASMQARGTGWPGWHVLLWVTVAMAAARTAAMGANRVIDRFIDARNPRTAGREVPSGKVSPAQAWVLVAGSLAVLTFAAAQLNPLCLALLPLAVVFLVGYPYTKRFTWLCHAWLGVTDGAAAAGGWIAVTGEFALGAWLLWAVVLFWMIGLDVIYATLDYRFDLANGIKSIPARFGIPPALRIAAASHALTFVLLALVGVVTGASFWYGLAVLIMGGILLYEHRLVNPQDLGRVNVAFFDANMWLALTMLAGVVADVTWRSLT